MCFKKLTYRIPNRGTNSSVQKTDMRFVFNDLRNSKRPVPVAGLRKSQTKNFCTVPLDSIPSSHIPSEIAQKNQENFL